MAFHKGCFLKNDELAGIAILNRCVIAPRKMRLIADLLRNKSVSFAFSILSCKQKKCTSLFEKLLLSAVSNFEKECEKENGKFYDHDNVFISTIRVDDAGILKRTLAAPQGRAMIIRKRLSNVAIIVRPSSKEKIDDKKKIIAKKSIKNVGKKKIVSDNKENSDKKINIKEDGAES